MPLSCEYDDCCDYWAIPDDDFSIAEHDCKCQSCKCKISTGNTVLRFECFRDADCESENPEDIKAWEDGEDRVYLPDEYQCERCGEIYLNLKEAGFCLYNNDHMPSLLKEYQLLTGFDPEKYEK